MSGKHTSTMFSWALMGSTIFSQCFFISYFTLPFVHTCILLLSSLSSQTLDVIKNWCFVINVEFNSRVYRHPTNFILQSCLYTVFNFLAQINSVQFKCNTLQINCSFFPIHQLITKGLALQNTKVSPSLQLTWNFLLHVNVILKLLVVNVLRWIFRYDQLVIRCSQC